MALGTSHNVMIDITHRTIVSSGLLVEFSGNLVGTEVFDCRSQRIDKGKITLLICDQKTRN